VFITTIYKKIYTIFILAYNLTLIYTFLSYLNFHFFFPISSNCLLILPFCLLNPIKCSLFPIHFITITTHKFILTHAFFPSLSNHTRSLVLLKNMNFHFALRSVFPLPPLLHFYQKLPTTTLIFSHAEFIQTNFLVLCGHFSFCLANKFFWLLQCSLVNKPRGFVLVFWYPLEKTPHILLIGTCSRSHYHQSRATLCGFFCV